MDEVAGTCSCRWKGKSGITIEKTDSLPPAILFEFQQKRQREAQAGTRYPPHPHLASQKSAWRSGKHTAYLSQPEPKHTARLVPDAQQDKEERRGWTPTPPSVDFIVTPTYVPGTLYRTESGEPGFIHLLGTDASPIEFEKLYIPRSIYESIAAQATIYAKQTIKKKLDARLKITAVEFCFLNIDPTADSFGRRDHTVKWASISDEEKDELIAFWRSKLDEPDVKFLPEHIIAWRMCTLVAYGLHGIKYDIRHCWSNSLLYQIPILKGFITRDLFKCIQTYVHFEDNEQNAVDVSDCSFKYRRICQQLKVFLQQNKQLSQDYDIDEGTLDTSSRKVRNSTRQRHKPSENMGVTINKLCDKSGYCWNWEEEHTEGDDSTAGIWRRLAQPAIDQGYRGLIGTVDSRFLGLEIVETLKDLADFSRTCSTLDSKRAGMPSAEITALDNDLTWGEYSFLYRNGMEIACWADHNVVHVLQNAFPPGWRGHVIRTDMQQKSSQVWMEVPYSVQHYNQEMAGTDTNNQRMKNNSSTKGRKYVRHPTKMVLYALNMNSNAGHLQYQDEHCGEACSSAFPKSDYLAAVVLAYIKELNASGVPLRTYGKQDLEEDVEVSESDDEAEEDVEVSVESEDEDEEVEAGGQPECPRCFLRSDTNPIPLSGQGNAHVVGPVVEEVGAARPTKKRKPTAGTISEPRAQQSIAGHFLQRVETRGGRDCVVCKKLLNKRVQCQWFCMKCKQINKAERTWGSTMHEQCFAKHKVHAELYEGSTQTRSSAAGAGSSASAAQVVQISESGKIWQVGEHKLEKVIEKTCRDCVNCAKRKQVQTACLKCREVNPDTRSTLWYMCAECFPILHYDAIAKVLSG
ncbi:hypothetical protein CYMTET_48414 [Cymbomonas tetramitiformis]|uniref:PiggyBac transposable element-derived protein domain-containing protein n=1 Tax=Cymbomonas tetramitiformis TaxID=36881 RepID=A0AAE0BTX7_9CHLO|nr:hypothetical protein CYMTET_48414 [Cymbomonas tetramitiformis]